MKFKFHGIAKDGSEKNGTVSADSEDEALRKIKAAGIFADCIDTVIEEVSALPIPSPPIMAKSFKSQLHPQSGEVVVSSGSICTEYNVLGLIVGFASKTEGCSGTIAVEDVYQTALLRLIEGARGRGANGLIHVNFQNRVASQAGCGSAKQVFEVFAWGTAIQF
jgi:uncharacterized protein YbjQ (UPF0145 family)